MDLFGDLPDPVAKVAVTSKEDIRNDKRTDNGVKRHLENNSLDGDDNPTEAKCPLIEDFPSSSTNPPKLSRTKYLCLKSYVAARKGERDEMQDAHVIIDDFTVYMRQLSTEVSTVAFYAVYDGHAGAKASQMAAKRLHLNLAERFPKGSVSLIEKDIKKVLFEVYKKTDEEFLREAAKIRPHWKDGSTAVTVLVVNNTMYIANIGDSKVVLGRGDNEGKLTALCLSRDHNPQDYEERQRIQRAGGSVKDGRINGILEVSRSLGDYQFKKQGVTCIPDVRKCTITEKDRFVIIACDGLWKSFTQDEAVAQVQKMLDETSSQPPKNEKSIERAPSMQSRYQSVCNRLANEAVLKLSGDNVTVMLISIESSSA